MSAEFWRVNSYGYPNPFSQISKAHEAWSTLEPFFELSSYSKLKEFWQTSDAPRSLTPHAVESWKATFEEFGLLYVPSGADEIHITPGGAQLRQAVEDANERQFAWVGLNLLFRYPLRGPRGARGGTHAASDLLPYRFLYASIRTLANYVWWTELERVLCTVFSRDQAGEAIESIHKLRNGDKHPDDFPLPVEQRRGAFYNSLNQIVVHAGLYYLTLDRSTDEELYGQPERKHWIPQDWIPMVDRVLGLGIGDPECHPSSEGPIEKLPAAPTFSNEEDYFEYLGAKVAPLSSTDESLPTLLFEEGVAFVLKRDEDYVSMTPTHVIGPIVKLCTLAPTHRIIVEDDLSWSYIVEDKQASSEGMVDVTIRRGRPVTNPGPVMALLGATA